MHTQPWGKRCWVPLPLRVTALHRTPHLINHLGKIIASLGVSQMRNPILEFHTGHVHTRVTKISIFCLHASNFSSGTKAGVLERLPITMHWGALCFDCLLMHSSVLIPAFLPVVVSLSVGHRLHTHTRATQLSSTFPSI